MGAALSPTEFLDSLKINLEREGEFQICLCLMIPLIYDQLDLPVPLLVQMAGVLSFVGSICLRRVLSRRTAANDCASRTEDRCAFDFSRCYPVCSIIDKCYGGKEHRRVSVCYIYSSLSIYQTFQLIIASELSALVQSTKGRASDAHDPNDVQTEAEDRSR